VLLQNRIRQLTQASPAVGTRVGGRESVEEGLIREIDEETGCELRQSPWPSRRSQETGLSMIRPTVNFPAAMAEHMEDGAGRRNPIAVIQHALDALGQAQDPGSRDLARAAERALADIVQGVGWRDGLLCDEAVEAAAGDLFAQDATEPIRDPAGGWQKERLRRAARSMLTIAIEAADKRGAGAAG
jgi:hypothetical protein